MNWLITGGSGSFGSHLILQLLRSPSNQVICFSRNPHHQNELLARVPAEQRSRLTLLLGDICDLDPLRQAVSMADIVIHAAALKHVNLGQANPLTFANVNIWGTFNVLRALEGSSIRRALLISTDKAVEPINLYGHTKAVAEYLWCHQRLASHTDTQRLAIRFGNILDASGSVLQHWRRAMELDQPLPVRAPEPTRFALTTNQAIAYVLRSLEVGQDGDILVPRNLPCLSIWDLARRFAPGRQWQITPLLRGEKQHEFLLNKDERNHLIMRTEFFITAARYRQRSAPYCSNSGMRLSALEIDQLLREMGYTAERDTRADSTA